MKTKRFLSIALTLVMLLGMFPGMSLTASAAGTTKTITPGTDDAKTGTGTMTITLIIKGDPAATDFDVTLPTSLAYDGKAKTATAAAKGTVTGMGTITVEYYKGGTKVDSAVDVGDYTFKLKVADDGTHYNAGTVENADWKFTITKGTPTVTKPTEKTLTYNGSAQELVNAGSTNDGTLYYAVTTENKAPTDENLYTTSIPTDTDVGTYYVWYKVVGDDNHSDTAPACVEVTVKSRPVYQLSAPSSALTVTSEIGTITRVTVDGKTVNSKYYFVSGSNVVLSEEFMSTLAPGKHTIRLYDGKTTATATWTIEGTASAQQAKTAATGDAGVTHYGVLAAAAAAAICAVLACAWVARKRKAA